MNRFDSVIFLFQIVSILANWANHGKIKLTDFEMDLRFAKLCKLLGRNKNTSSSEDMGDLSVVLGVTADEHAAKLVSSISLQQMINVNMFQLVRTFS